MAKFFAWFAHFYTSLGLVCAAIIAVLIVQGGDRSFRLAFLWMMIATAIDATDGWIARRARVTEVLPQFDGRILDDLVDVHQFVSLPLLLLWRAGVLSGASAWLLVLPAVPLAATLSAPGQPSDEPSAVSAKAQGTPDDSAIGMPAADMLAVPSDRVVDRHTGRSRRDGGLRTMHTVLRL